MPRQFIRHEFNNNPSFTKVQLLPNNIASSIYVDIEGFEDYFYEKILNLYNEIHSNSYARFLLLPDEFQSSYLKSLKPDNLEEILEFIKGVDEQLGFITNDLFSIVTQINTKKGILQNINPYITPLDGLIRYISICLTIIDNDYKEFSSKYIKGINYSFSRLISNILNLWESKNKIQEIHAEDDKDDDFFQEVCSEYSEHPAVVIEVDGKVMIKSLK